MRRRLHAGPTIATLVIVGLIAWSFWVALASASTLSQAGGDDSQATATAVHAWSARWESRARARVPMPSGAPVAVVLGPVVVAGQQAGGLWDGTSVLVASLNEDVLMHELGHAFDGRDLNDPERVHLMALMGYPPDTPWTNPRRWTEDVFCRWLACPNERFADLYRGCALDYIIARSDGTGDAMPTGGRGAPWWSSGYVLAVANYDRICGAIRRYATDPGA